MYYESLSFANNFMFAKVMRNPTLCKKLLEVILSVEIEKIEYPEEEKVIDIAADSKSVRLDVYVKDEKSTIYNVEMQATDTKELPKRSRYYQAMIDLNLIEKGQTYGTLNKGYVIFICMVDIFGKGRHLYTFENLCLQDKTLSLGDETTKVFLNPYSDMNDVDKELSNFLKYLADGTVSDGFTQELSDEVLKAKQNKEWRREYMALHLKEQADRQDARAAGLAEGRAEGRAEGQKRAVLKMLNKGISLNEIQEFFDFSLDELKEIESSFLTGKI
jgi:predicted transposase/invertase (TIGR01784 family)